MAQAGPAKPRNNNIEFQPNPLDSYDLSIYNLKLYMIPEVDILNGNVDSDNKVIIAETGVTTQVNIDDLEIRSVIGPERNIKNQESFQFDFTLREYYGAGLLDQIFFASRELGIRNYSKAPYFLELTFAGRDRDTGVPATDLKSYRWVWPIGIREIITEVDASGSLYSVRAFHYGDLGTFADVGSIPKQITVKGETVGEAIADMQTQINKNLEYEAVNNVTAPDVYTFTVSEDIANLKLVDDIATLAPAWTSDFSNDGNRTVREIALDKNLNIGESINRIVSASPGYQTLIKNTATASSQDVTDAEKTKQLHRIFTDVKLTQYDIGRGDYVKNVSYIVEKYEMSTLQMSVSESGLDGKVKTDELKSKGLLRKRYDYLYSGVNDQVIDFDLRFNLGWYVNMPKEGGLFTQHANSVEGQHVSKVYYEYLRIREEIAQARKLSENTAISNPNNAQQIQQEIDNSNLPPEEREQLERLLNASLQPVSYTHLTLPTNREV